MLGLLQGPRIKTEATYALENLIKDLLNPSDKISNQYNAIGELEIQSARAS
jgi:hypothetical protein